VAEDPEQFTTTVRDWPAAPYYPNLGSGLGGNSSAGGIYLAPETYCLAYTGNSGLSGSFEWRFAYICPS
jgi:hypothetical protein